jgi:hypothetical protein
MPVYSIAVVGAREWNHTSFPSLTVSEENISEVRKDCPVPPSGMFLQNYR